MNTGRSSSNLVCRREWDEGRKREEKEDDEEEKKERTVKRFQPERFHSGNRFLIVERTVGIQHLPYSRNMSLKIWDIYAYHRTSIDFLFFFLLT